MSLTNTMAWLNLSMRFSSIGKKKPTPAKPGWTYITKTWFTSSYTPSVRGGILPEHQGYQNPAGRQPGKTHTPTPMIVKTMTISRTIPAQPAPFGLMPCFAANASTASLACLRPTPVCSR